MKFALVGSSGFAETTAAPALAQVTDVVGILGSTPERGGRLAAQGYGRAFESLDELLDDGNIDAVWVAATDLLHARIGLECLNAGKHVLVEKPMATTGSDAAALVAAAHANNVVLRVGCHLRFRPAYQQLKAYVSDGTFGTVGLLRVHFLLPDLEPNWRCLTIADSGGAWATLAAGSHLFDLLLWVMGMPEATVEGAILATHRWPIETDDTSSVLIRLGADLAAVVTMGFGLHGGPSLFEIHGTAGWARAADVFFGGGHLETSAGSRIEYSSRRLDPYVAQLLDFASAVGGGRSIGADGEAGLAVTRLIADAVASLRAV